jgi:hypothetical protein
MHKKEEIVKNSWEGIQKAITLKRKREWKNHV